MPIQKDNLGKVRFQPKQTIDPAVLMALNIDAISIDLKTLVNIQLQNQELLTEILRELKEGADEGKVLHSNGTVLSNDFTFIETEVAPGHPVKAFNITNDGPNPIYFGFNVSKGGLQPNLDNVTSPISRFRLIQVDEDAGFSFNRNKIRNVALLSQQETSTYRLWLIW